MATKLPTMIRVVSSNIRSMGHDRSGMFVEFDSGGTYYYPGVPRSLFDQGLAAPSIGRWLNTEVKANFKGEKIDAEFDAG